MVIITEHTLPPGEILIWGEGAILIPITLPSPRFVHFVDEGNPRYAMLTSLSPDS